jgi:NAD(P)-dependent dehydrogenase (short-subunit alcohol dehydrogenase family)
VWRSARAVTAHMQQLRRGSIVLTSSVNGLEAGLNRAHYTAAKHGVLGLMRTIALELGPYGVRCNALCPGAVLTPMIDHQQVYDVVSGHHGGTRQEMLANGHHTTALRDTGFLPPEDVANTAAFLNSDLAVHVTGVAIPVDAGHLLLEGINTQPVLSD